jgi:hypothetical protein
VIEDIRLRCVQFSEVGFSLLNDHLQQRGREEREREKVRERERLREKEVKGVSFVSDYKDSDLESLKD